MSLFLAWMPPPDAITRLTVLRDSCRNADTHGWTAWRQNAQLHVTLRFLAHVPPEEHTGLDDSLAAIAAQTAPFTIAFDRIEPWASALVCRTADSEPLRQLLSALNSAAMAAGYAELDSQTPHLTLAYPPRDHAGHKHRITSAPAPDARLLPVAAGFDRFALVQTVPGGYRSVREWSLSGTA